MNAGNVIKPASEKKLNPKESLFKKGKQRYVIK